MDNGFQEVLDPEITLEVLVLEMTIHGLEDFQEDPDPEIILQLETIGLQEDRDRVTMYRWNDGVEDLYLHHLVYTRLSTRMISEKVIGASQTLQTDLQ